MKIYKQRDYISWSAFSLYKKSPAEYERIYLKGEQGFTNEAMYFGSSLHEGLDKGSDDVAIEAVRLILPNYPRREYGITIEYKGVKLRGVIDIFDPRKLKIGEIKTGRKFTQTMTDNSGQLKFYNLLCLAKYGKMAKEINLYWFETEKDENDKVKLTGKHRVFRVKHTLADILLFFSDVKKINNQIINLRKKYGNNK